MTANKDLPLVQNAIPAAWAVRDPVATEALTREIRELARMRKATILANSGATSSQSAIHHDLSQPVVTRIYICFAGIGNLLGFLVCPLAQSHPGAFLA